MDASDYRVLLAEIPKNYFKPYPWRLVPFFLVTSGWLAGVFSLITIPMLWPLKVVIALGVGHLWGMSGLLCHEILHGSVIKNKKLQNTLAFIGLFPFLISPTFWRFWHNKLHHGHTQRMIMDPDAYPTYRIFKQSKFSQWMYPITPGSGKKISYLYLFVWFCFNIQVFQFYFRFRNRIFENVNHRKVNIEMTAMFGLFVVYLVFAGPTNWLWVWLLPFLVQNYVVFSYISTNHNLSPLTSKNDPLENSLSVTNHPVLEFFHFNFGYHVEHHIFPTVNPVYNKKVHTVLKEKFPDRYHCWPKWKAIRELYRTARIYKNSKILFNPLTGEKYKTISSPPKAKLNNESVPSVQQNVQTENTIQL